MKKVELLSNSGSYDSKSQIEEVLKAIEQFSENNKGKKFLLTLEEAEELR